MNRRLASTPRCIVIAGPNGAGKTTFARKFLPKDARVGHFANADHHCRPVLSGFNELKKGLRYALESCQSSYQYH